MKRILVPTDFSECALNALKQAAEIARKSGASIDLVHAALTDELTNHQEKFDNISSSNFLEGVALKEHFLSGVEIKQILENESLKNPDLIIMGTHGTSNWKEDAMGSNAANIILSANVPVLVIKTNQTVHLKNVVFASSFNSETIHSFGELKKFIQQKDTTIHLLFVIIPSFFTTTDAAESKMETFAKNVGLENYSVNIYNDKTVEDGIHHFSKKIKADLIAMETHGRSGLAHFFSGSITEDVVNHAKLPVLSTRIRL
ncbi:MAG: universal stress protein [Flavobacteriaceae bacterium]|nr:universal stress protein [Flavobacteriaceae bacterium]